MATTIDKYVLETSVTGMKDVDALNTSVKTLGSSIDTVTAKKISMTINIDNLSELSNTIKSIDTSLSNIATKTVKPSVDIASFDRLNATMRSLATSINEINSKNLNIKVNDSEVTRAKGDVSLLNNEIDKVNGKTVSIKADNGPESLLSQNLTNIGDAFKSIATNAIAAVGVALAAMTIKTVDAAGALTDLSNASSMTTSELEGLKRSIIDAGGSADDGATFVNKLLLSITDAANGSKPAIDAFKALKVPIKDSNGEMRSTTDIARDLVLALGNTTDKTKQQALATEILGKSLSNLNFKDIKFQDDATLNNQIKKIDEVGGAWDRLGAALSKLGFSAVSGEASKMEGTLNKLTWVVEKITDGFDLMNRQLPIIGSGFEFLGKLMNPGLTIMEKYGNAVGWVADKYKELAGWIGKMGNVVPPQFQAAADAAYKSPAASKDAFDMSKGYRGKGYRDQRLPAIKDDQYGTPKPSGGGGGAADAAAREAEARKRSREESEAQLKAMQLLQEEEQKLAQLQIDRIGQNKEDTALIIEQAQIEKTLTLDLAKVNAEITKEKQKGKDVDQYILDNLQKQKDLIIDNAVAQSKLSDARQLSLRNERDNIAKYKQIVNSLEDSFDRIKPDEISNDNPRTSALDKAKKEFERTKTAAKNQLKLIQDMYGEVGPNSEAFQDLMETQQTESERYIESLERQRILINNLQTAEKERAESFAGGWEDAMTRMTEAMKPAQLGAQAFDSLWGNIETTLSNTIATGKFEFTQFRDKVIADIALMAAKAVASNLIGKILGTAVSAVLPGAGEVVGNAAQGLKMPKFSAKGGSVSGNQPYIVGERGPELFMPGQNGTVIPNRNLTDTKPTVNNYYTYNVSAVDGQSVARFFMENKNMVAAANSAAKKERS